MQKQIDELSSDVSKFEKEKKSNQKVLSKKEDLIADYETQIQELKKENEQWKLKISSLNAEIKQFKSNESNYTNENKELKEEIEDNKKEISEKTKEIDSLKDNLNLKEKELEQLIKEISNLEKEKDTIKKTQSKIEVKKEEKTKNPIISPSTYDVVKCTSMKELQWYLLRTKSKDEDTATFDDYLWYPITSKTEFNKFDNLPLSSSIEYQKEIESLQQDQLELIDKLAKKEREYNKLNLQTVKLINRKKTDEPGQDKLLDVIDKLKEDNKYLQNALQNAKYTNVNGLSFINEEHNNSDFIDEKNFDDILTELSKNKNYAPTIVNYPKYNTRLIKAQFEKLLTEISISQNAKATLANILKTLSLSEDEIYQLISKYRGPISLK